jgi:hypothetical protein
MSMEQPGSLKRSRRLAEARSTADFHVLDVFDVFVCWTMYESMDMIDDTMHLRPSECEQWY